jgi:hypothetical protein
MAGNSHRPGEVEETARPQAAVDQETRRRLAAAGQFPLQQIIHENGGQAEIAQEIVHPAPAAISYQYEINGEGGDNDIAVKLA